MASAARKRMRRRDRRKARQRGWGRAGSQPGAKAAHHVSDLPGDQIARAKAARGGDWVRWYRWTTKRPPGARTLSR